MDVSERYGPWALVAGASTGLGEAFADCAAERGLNVILVARRTELLHACAEGLRNRHGVEVRVVELDLGALDAAEQVTAAVEGLEVGLLIYNAAAHLRGRFVESTNEQLATNIAVNVTTPTALARLLAPPMIGRRRGGIVLLTSTGAVQGIKVFVAYGAAKAYQLILGEGLWDELREFGVDAFSYVIGATATPTFLANASEISLSPEQVAEIATISGQAMAAPRSPESVAVELFAILERQRGDIGPRHYSHPDDEARVISDGSRPRAEVVGDMGQMTGALYP